MIWAEQVTRIYGQVGQSRYRGFCITIKWHSQALIFCTTVKTSSENTSENTPHQFLSGELCAIICTELCARRGALRNGNREDGQAECTPASGNRRCPSSLRCALPDKYVMSCTRRCLTITHTTAVSGCVVLIYDLILTFPKEVYYVWSKRHFWLVKLSYAMNRYGVTALTIFYLSCKTFVMQRSTSLWDCLCHSYYSL